MNSLLPANGVISFSGRKIPHTQTKKPGSLSVQPGLCGKFMREVI
jgi:hypothetical protein